MNNYPKITIVTPNYNLGEYLEQTILSVVNQNYPNLEYIIIDGGSTDNSLEIIKKYEDKLAFWSSESDNGLYDAIQKGFDRSNGDIMCWLNSDDLLHPYSLFYIAKIFESFQEVEWVLGRPSYFDENGGLFNIDTIKKWSKYHFFTGNYQWIQQESTFWRRDLWKKVNSKLNTNLKLAGDFDLWIRFFEKSDLYATSVILGGFRHRTNQLSKIQLANYHQEVNMVLQKHLREVSTHFKYKVIGAKVLFLIAKILSRIRFLNTSTLNNRIVPTLLGAKPIIHYDYRNSSFYMK